MVAEYAFTGIGKDESNLTHTDDPLGSMWHELGHAVDHVMGMLSKDPEYLRRYKKDLSNIDPEAYESLKYYTQGSGGPSETFAEMFCTIYGNRNTNSRNAKAEQLYNSFGSLASFIKGKVTELR